MKKIKILSIITFAISATGCLKDKPNSDFSNLAPVAEISSGSLSSANSPISGLDYFNAATLPYIGADTTYEVTFNVNITGEFPPAKDVTVTLGVDDAKRMAYNSNLAPADQFVLPADSNYSFAVKTAVIKAGTRLTKFSVTFYPQTLDPSKSYMLPLTITDASGLLISGNLSTVYLHIIGNPLAGVYNWDWKRYNAADTLGEPNGASFTGGSATFVPDNANTIEIQSGYADQNGTDIHYVLSFTNTAGVFSDFKVKLNPTDVTEHLTGPTIGALSYTDATILIADGVNKHFKFTYAVVNSAGASRTFIDEFYK